MKSFNWICKTIAIVMLSTFVSCSGSVKEPVSATDPSDISAVKQSSENPEYPSPSKADVLKLEKIEFTPDTTPMPWIDSYEEAAHDGDVAAQFIMHMMFREMMYNDDLNTSETDSDSLKHPWYELLSWNELLMEMIRWRDNLNESGDELGRLATEPSIIFEISPQFSVNDTYRKEMDWLVEAANHGYGNSEYILGLVYWNGIGVEKDQAKAYELLVRAAAHGIPFASFAIGMIHELGLLSDPSISRDTANPSKEIKSLFWLKKADVQQVINFNEDAHFILTMKFADHIGIPDDKDVADSYSPGPETKIHHLWELLYTSHKNQLGHLICTFDFDQGNVSPYSSYVLRNNNNSNSKSIYDSDIDDDSEYSEGNGECGEEPEDYDNDEAFIKEYADKLLEYKIDYKLAGQWLKIHASDLSNVNVRIVRTQTRVITGCRGNLNNDPVIAPEIIKKLVDYEDNSNQINRYHSDGIPHNILNSFIAMEIDEPRMTAEQVLNSYKNAADKENMNALIFLGDLYSKAYKGEAPLYQTLREQWNIPNDNDKAYDYYRRADQYGYARYIALDEIRNSKDNNDSQSFIKWDNLLYEYDSKKYSEYMNVKSYSDAGGIAKNIRVLAIESNNTSRAYEWALKYIDAYEKQYESYSKDCKSASPDLAAKNIGNMMKEIKDDEKAIEWYKNGFALNLKCHGIYYGINWGDEKGYTYKLAMLYGFGSEKVQNKNMALKYAMLFALYTKNDSQIYVAERADVAFLIGKITEEGTESIKPDKSLAIEWYRVADAYCGSDKDCSEETQAGLKKVMDQIGPQPKIEDKIKLPEINMTKEDLIKEIQETLPSVQ